MLIWRAQSRMVQRVMVRRGKPESTTASSTAGHGLQVVTPEGRTALASRDDLRGDEALSLFGRVAEVATRGELLGLETAELPKLEAVTDRRLPAQAPEFERIRLDEAARRLVELESEILARKSASATAPSWMPGASSAPTAPTCCSPCLAARSAPTPPTKVTGSVTAWPPRCSAPLLGWPGTSRT